MALLFAMTIPGLAVGLLVCAAVDRLVLARRGRRLFGARAQNSVGSTGFDELTALLYAGKRAELDQRSAVALLRDDAGDADPLRADARTGRPRVRLTLAPSAGLPRAAGPGRAT